MASQRAASWSYEALRSGRYTSWDHQPVRDASRLYVRNDQDLGDFEAMARFPRGCHSTRPAKRRRSPVLHA